MSYCRNCGAKIEPDAAVCPKCGTPTGIGPQSGDARTSGMRTQESQPAMWRGRPVQQAGAYRPQTYRPETYHEEKGRRRGGVPVPVVILLLAAVIAGAVFFVRQNRQVASSTVDLAGCIHSPSFEGMSGEGTMTDEPYLDGDLVRSALGKTKEYGGEDSSIPDIGPLMDEVSVSTDKTSELSNGDKVTVSLSYDGNYLENKYNVRFTGTSKTYTIDNLTSLTELDPFDKIILTYSGYSPAAQVSIDSDALNDSEMKQVFRSADEVRDSYSVTVNGEPAENRYVAIGDKLEISLTDRGEELMKERYYKPSSTSKTVTVTAADVDSYVTKYSDITKENLDAIRSQSMDEMNSYTSSDDDYHGQQAEYDGTFFMVPKDGHWDVGDGHHRLPWLVLIYSMPMARDSGDGQQTPYTRYFTRWIATPYNEAQKGTEDTEAGDTSSGQLIFDDAFTLDQDGIQYYDSDKDDGKGRLFDDTIVRFLENYTFVNADGLDDFLKLRKNVNPDPSIA